MSKTFLSLAVFRFPFNNQIVLACILYIYIYIYIYVYRICKHVFIYELFHTAYLNSLITDVEDFGKIRYYLLNEDSSIFSEINRIKYCLSSKEIVEI